MSDSKTAMPMYCSKCGKESSILYTFGGSLDPLCPACLPTTTLLPAALGPNNCVRFVYGRGCYDCHQRGLCWPTTASSVTL